MIQRKQSIWLLIASLSILLTLVIPYGIHTESTIGSELVTTTDLLLGGHKILMIFVVITSLYLLVLIFLFKNRKQQMKLTLLGMLMILGILAYQIYDSNFHEVSNKLVIGLLGNKLYLGILIPIITIFFLILAYSGIRSDEKLVRDSDRLR